MNRGDRRDHARSVADVELVVGETRQILLESLLVYARVPLFAEEDFPLVVVDAMHRPAKSMKMTARLGTDEPDEPATSRDRVMACLSS